MAVDYKFLGRVNVEEYVPVKLFSGNYSTWKANMESLFEKHKLEGFIDGTIRAPLYDPTFDDGEDYDVWMADKVVKKWIHCTIKDPKLIDLVSKCVSAKQAWIALNHSFQTHDDEKGAPLHNGGGGSTHDTSEKENVESTSRESMLPALKAAQHDNWDEALRLLRLNLTSYTDDTVKKDWDDLVVLLKYSITTGKEKEIVKLLSEFMPDEFVHYEDDNRGWSFLHYAAAVDNVKAAKALVRRSPHLCYIPDENGNFPIQIAAQNAQRNMLDFFMSERRKDNHPNNHSNPYAGSVGLRLLINAIDAEFFDIALELVENYPDLATIKLPYQQRDISALEKLVGKSVLSNRRDFTFWEHLVSYWISILLPLL